MAETIMNGNGTALKWSLGIASALLVGAVGWLFSTTVQLREDYKQHEYRIEACRNDIDRGRTAQDIFQVDMRGSISHVTDILTDLRIQLGGTKATIRK